MSNELLLATGNSHKVREIQSIVAPLLPDTVKIVCLADIGLESPPPEVESCLTFAGNAMAKAAWCRDRSGMTCFADDSGLCVDALSGAPGVRSARWAGPTDADRNEALLAELSQAGALTPEARLARFVCSAACAIAGGDIVVATGESRGRILTQPTGGAGGFGYDPLFFCPELGATFAQAGDEAKNTVSHRARAFRLLISRCACFMP